MSTTVTTAKRLTEYLRVENLNVYISGFHLVKELSFQVCTGERIGLIGPSGSGKSLTLKALVGLLPPGSRRSGLIQVGGRDFSHASDKQLAHWRGRGVGFIFQNPATALMPCWTVERIVATPLRLHYRLSRINQRERVINMLERVGLGKKYLRHYPHELSGGQAQRVALAAALITSPRLILADEPTTALDSVTATQVAQLLVDLVEDLGATLVFVTHDFGILSQVTTRALVLDHGALDCMGEIRQLCAKPPTAHARRLVETARSVSLPKVGDALSQAEKEG